MSRLEDAADLARMATSRIAPVARLIADAAYPHRAGVRAMRTGSAEDIQRADDALTVHDAYVEGARTVAAVVKEKLLRR